MSEAASRRGRSQALRAGGDSLFKRALRAQCRAAQEPRFEIIRQPLFGNERPGRIELLQRQFRRAPINVKHCVEERSIDQGEGVSKALGECQ